MKITSLENEKIKYYKKLEKKKYRDLYEEFLVEGSHLVLEAYKSGCLKEVILCEGGDLFLPVPFIEVTYEILKKLSQVETPQKIMGLCTKKNDTTVGNRILILDGLQDPGNVGTILRSAKAFDIDTVIFGKNCVDPYNPKVVRASQGMLFHLPLVFFDIKEVIPILKGLSIPVFATNVEKGCEISTLSADERDRFALIVGNEGSGVEKEILDMSDKNIYIPMNDAVESLNVAVATSILLYEMRREK